MSYSGRSSFLLELFNNGVLPYEWETTHPEYWHAQFSSAQVEYSIICSKEDNYIDPGTGEAVSLWELSFVPSDNSLSDRVIGTDGNEFRIFATAISGFREFINAKKPDFFAISAAKDQPKRVELYRAMLKRFSKEISAEGYQSYPSLQHKYVDTEKYYESFVFKRIR